ncbi:hypothetical protein BKA83DRAFT_4377661 [Pisolithus microcarpus]|nr:hypothetical protein BKA83DRAFT_4377661 [Pisolithus microcarpus]
MPLANTCVCVLFCAITRTLCASFKLPVLSVLYVLVVFPQIIFLMQSYYFDILFSIEREKAFHHRSSSIRSSLQCIFRKMFSSKSRNKHIWDRPWLLDSATYKLNRLRAPDREVWQCQF